jgi:hypothetical protein
LNEFIFKASDNGQLYIDAATNNKVILRPGDNTTAQAVQQKNEDYTQLLFQLNETTGTGAHGNNVFIHSALVTDQIRDAITAEAVSAAFAEPTDYVDFQNWQKLTLKRMAASVMFQNGLLRTLKLLWNLLERSAHQASIIQTAKTCYK